MKSPKVRGIGEVVTEYGAKVMKIFEKGLLGRSLFDFYGDIKAKTFRTKESSSVPRTPVDGDGGVIYTKSADGKLYYKSNEISEVELSSQGTNTTYSVSCVDGDNSDEEKIRLSGSDSSTDDVVLEAGTGLSIARSGDKITFTNTVSDTDTNTQNTTTLSFVDSSNDIILRNTTGGAGSGTDDIKFVAGSNITLTHTDADNITIASTDTNTQLSTEEVQDIAGALVATGGTKTNISVTYDDANGNMDFVVASDLNTTGTAGGLSSTLAVSSGGTGATTLTDNSILTGTGTSAITAEANLSFSGDELTLGGDDNNTFVVKRKTHGDESGGRLAIFAGRATGTNKAGGDLTLNAGSGTGTGAGGVIQFYSSPAGSSGSSVNSEAVIAAFDNVGNLSIEGDLTVKGNDIKDDDGTTCITFDSSGNTSVGGNLAVTGTIHGKILQSFPWHFVGFSPGTLTRYIPWVTPPNEQTVADQDEVSMMMPMSGRLKSVFIRTNAFRGGSDDTGSITISVVTNDVGSNASTHSDYNVVESEAITGIAGNDDHKALNFIFDTAQHWTAGDVVSLKIEGADTGVGTGSDGIFGSGGLEFWGACVVEWDTTHGNSNATSSAKYSS